MASSEQPVNVPISNLPTEMLQTIFEHLTFHERLIASVTCKLWHSLIFCPQFRKRIFLHLRTANDIVEKLHHGEMIGRCSNVVISCSDIGDNDRMMLETCMTGATLDLLRISTNESDVQLILDTSLNVVTELEFLHLDMWDSQGDDTIRITHEKLKSIVVRTQRSYTIVCESLTTLKTNYLDEQVIQDAHRRQLRSLKLTVINRDSYNSTTFNIMSSNQWDHLQELCFFYPPPLDQLKEMLQRMPCLKKLSLHGSQLNVTGEKLEPAQSLHDLTLAEQYLETDSINNTFFTSSSLHSLSLLHCTCSEVPLKSNSIQRLTLRPMLGKRFPLFPNLKILAFEGTYKTDFCFALTQICEIYTELEKLTIGVVFGQIGKFKIPTETNEVATASPFSLLKKLDGLKVLQLNRMDVTKIDWTACTGSKVEFIHLVRCFIDGDGAKQLVQTFKNLRKLYLDYCNLRRPRTDVFGIANTCNKGLRTLVPHCRISYRGCRS